MRTANIKHLLFSFIFLFTLSNCVESNDDPTNNYPKKVGIEYKISSPTIPSASIRYTNDTGGETEVQGATLPFSKKIEKTVAFAEIVSLAGVSTDMSGALKLEILVDGKVAETKTFEGSGGTLVGSTIYQFK